MDRRVFSSKASEIWCLLFVRTGVHSGHSLCRLGNQIGQKSCQINMEIPDILSKDGILISLDVGSKKQALQVLVEHVASQTNLAEHKILDVLWREKDSVQLALEAASLFRMGSYLNSIR